MRMPDNCEPKDCKHREVESTVLNVVRYTINGICHSFTPKTEKK